MVVHNLHVKGVTVAPYEADTPLIVDADTMLACPLTGQRFKTISRWRLQIGEFTGAINQFQFSCCKALDVPRKFGGEPTAEYLLRFLAFE